MSRIGSLLLEPFLRRVHFITFASYDKFVRACKADPKLEVLSATNNMYRTFCALLLSVGAVVGYERLSLRFPFLRDAATSVCIVGLLALFLLARSPSIPLLG